jgi:hypothetical protein
MFGCSIGVKKINLGGKSGYVFGRCTRMKNVPPEYGDPGYFALAHAIIGSSYGRECYSQVHR